MKRTLKEIITLVDSLNPNAYPEEVKASWVNEVEAYIQGEIYNLAPTDITAFVPYSECMDMELSLDAGYEKIYVTYLNAMIDFANKDFSSYNNTITLYNSYMEDYAKWYIRHHGEGETLISGMYISAYGIAVKHGFSGTEEEWLLSLKGEKGDTGHGLEIKGVVESLELLPENASEGDIYQVGKEGELYLRSDEDWKPLGTYKGDKGEKGDKGDKGEKGDRGEAFTYEDFTSSQLALLKGPKGDKGEKGDKGDSGEDGTSFVPCVKGYRIRSAEINKCIIETDGSVTSDISEDLVGRRFNVFYKEDGLLEKVRSFIESVTMIDGDFTRYKVVFSQLHPLNYLPEDFKVEDTEEILGNMVISPDENGEFPPGVIDLTDAEEMFTSAIFGINCVGYLGTITAGVDCIAAAYCAVSMGRGNFVDQEYGVALGYKNKVRKHVGVALGTSNEVDGLYGTAVGRGLRVLSDYQSVTGEYNIPDLLWKYCFIVGNGTNDDNRSNAFTLDFDGNGWVKKDFVTGGNIETNDLAAKGNIASSGEIKDGKDNVLSEKMDKITIDNDITKAGKGISDISTMTPVEGVTVEGSYGIYADDKAIGYNAEKPLSVKNLYSTNPSANLPSHKHVLADGKITGIEEVTDGYKFAYADFGVGLYNTTEPYKTIVELDLSNHIDTVFSGLRVYSRKMIISGVGTAKINSGNVISKAYLYVSDDGETWYRSNLISIPAGAHRYVDLPFTYGEGERINLTGIKYIKLEIVELGGSLKNYHWGSEEILLLKEVDSLPTSRAARDYVDEKMGDVETALDSIIAIQESLIGGTK